MTHDELLSAIEQLPPELLEHVAGFVEGLRRQRARGNPAEMLGHLDDEARRPQREPMAENLRYLLEGPVCTTCGQRHRTPCPQLARALQSVADSAAAFDQGSQRPGRQE